ncbi:hypothetical protein GUJ93_ZPchr0010g8149 [Zizania palustris]|uniref:Uncharacterized protein n=1 Tax=Zizania palustris TaxID=103762 RepID=A0A8J6BIS4_ZIZPA|nr:hypothetical protein GUJ93_ZPchr0010g8149 [Zizania palustris]
MSAPPCHPATPKPRAVLPPLTFCLTPATPYHPAFPHLKHNTAPPPSHHPPRFSWRKRCPAALPSSRCYPHPNLALPMRLFPSCLPSLWVVE